ncbi:rod shape-determining protein MreD [Solemya velesiana gill symbiont]|uniref:Rod shape-determining protein MreD n=1 Tax=Solemya velesiana gill symbiont TaxID=1918948 RepID=A0A1T2KYF8_9GAMM|nr:rod shape-determining protein MreD [Solemya velesiana gill symbiont]OOZ37790.1 rod shape-determining protein MreD [Solemya velesiana gill symbiont]
MTLAPKRGGIVIALTILVALLLTILPLPEWAQPFRPQWHTLVLIYWTLALPQRVGVAIGWMIGLSIDVMTGTLLGQHALSLSLIAFLTYKMHQRVRLFPLWQQSLTVLVLLLLEKLLSLWVMGVADRPTPPLLYWAPPLVGMFLWPWVYIILRDLRRKFQVS